MTKKLIWRLGKLPSVEELQSLVKDKIITHDEAREILFSKEEVEERDKKSLETEIKFLRELIQKLSERETIIRNIQTIELPYRKQEWYTPYYYWTTATAGSCPATLTVTGGNSIATINAYSANCAFDEIKTF